ncbi:MAG TPA: nucleolar RNA-binding Nop10p family protein [Candidatus Nanoarchaeia archaeon]|nr:nucleolar RNA-binding Nop10p family protein [Candidatus Nanoarchaeia archaeon]
MKKLLLCLSCKLYTLKGECPNCGLQPVTPKPQRFSIEDPYGQYRREAKREKLKSEGLI